ncbi:DUF4372 domain-containing protein [Chitinophaga sp. CF418]|uniref:DUF4372 domain-containing protein n=1 Tax=Chitinophaga sp. CF418 TaxID=1855287 RepID=UPI0009115218|nr:DUF4372 domain-containing protein [Chitinophaga sp. CF418]SHN07603.1 protein of unknown function [Chitinophaga sp. CF418]
MNIGEYIFAQISSFLSQRIFDGIVARYKGDHRIRHFSCWNQMMSMMYGQLSNRESFSDLVLTINAHSQKAYHLGFGKGVSKANLAKANENNHDPHIPCSRDLNSLFSPQFRQRELSDIVTYLNNGVSVIRFISNVYDESGGLIGPNIIYTDGLWIWPSYYSFYLKKHPQIEVPEEFILWVGSNGQKMVDLSQSEKNYVEYVIAKMSGINMLSRVGVSPDLKKIIEQRGDDIFCF